MIKTYFVAVIQNVNNARDREVKRAAPEPPKRRTSLSTNKQVLKRTSSGSELLVPLSVLASPDNTQSAPLWGGAGGSLEKMAPLSRPDRLPAGGVTNDISSEDVGSSCNEVDPTLAAEHGSTS